MSGYSSTCFKRPSIQVTWTSLLTGGCLLLNESSAESSCMSFLHYFHAAISNHLSEKPKISSFIWSLNTGLTVTYMHLGYIKIHHCYQRWLSGTIGKICRQTSLHPLHRNTSTIEYVKNSKDDAHILFVCVWWGFMGLLHISGHSKPGHLS